MTHVPLIHPKRVSSLQYYILLISSVSIYFLSKPQDDDRFYAKHGKKKKEAEKKLLEIMAHTQAHYCHESLGSEIRLKVSIRN